MKLSELISVIPFVKQMNVKEDMEITAIHADSRLVQPGCVFVCVRGLRTDGHKYVKEAIEKGAVAIVAEEKTDITVPLFVVSDTTHVLAQLVNKFYEYPTASLPLIGITGTNGKTTVSYLLEAIYKLLGKKTGIIGSIQNKIGDKPFASTYTTPDVLELQCIFSKMKEEKVEQIMMEVSSHALDMGRVYGCEFDTVIFTNFSQDHLDYHGNEFHYFYAKSLLFSQLGNAYASKRKYAIINTDDPYAERLKKLTAHTILTYGIKNNADVTAEDIQLYPDYTKFRLKTPHGTVKITSRLIGEFNIYNMLAASTAAIVNQTPLRVIEKALSTIRSIPGRFEVVKIKKDCTVIVDYAHTPDALENILKTSRELSASNLYVVVGCGGNRDASKRPLMGQAAVKYADYTIFTTDNPRNENPASILSDMVAILDSTANNFETELDRKKAIEKAVQYAEAGDTIVIAGKGHEAYQEIAGVKYPFDDRKIVQNAT